MMKIQYLTNIVHTKYNTFTEAMKIQIIYYKGTKTFFVVKKKPKSKQIEVNTGDISLPWLYFLSFHP